MKWMTEGFGLVQYLCLKMVSLYSAAPLNIFLKGHIIRLVLTYSFDGGIGFWLGSW